MSSDPSVSIPTFVFLSGMLRDERRNQRDISNVMISSVVLDLTFLLELAAIMIRNVKSTTLDKDEDSLYS